MNSQIMQWQKEIFGRLIAIASDIYAVQHQYIDVA